MLKDEVAIGNVYQLIVLISIIVLNILAFIKTGQFNDILIGAIVGVMAGLPAKK